MRLNVLALFTAPRGSATLSSEKLSCFGGGFLKENAFFWTLETSLVLQQEGAGVEEPFSPLWGMQGWLLFLSSFRAKRCPVVLLGLSLNYVKQQLVDAAIKGDEGEGGWEQKEAQRDPSPWRTAGIQVHKENPRLQIPPLLLCLEEPSIIWPWWFSLLLDSVLLGSLLKPQVADS